MRQKVWLGHKNKKKVEGKENKSEGGREKQRNGDNGNKR